MSSTLHAPSPTEVGEFLSNLFGLQIKGTEAGGVDPSSVRGFAAYCDDGGSLRAAIFCDIHCAAKLGAALTQIPIGGVEDAINDDSLPGNIAENLGEVFNIGVNIFHESNAPRLVMSSVATGAEAASAYSSQVADGTAVSCFELEIQRYGKGRLGVVIL